MRAARPYLLLAALALVLLVADYAVALGTGIGLRADRAAVDGAVAGPLARTGTSFLVHTIEDASLAAFGLGLVALALLRGRKGHAVAAIALIGGAIVTTEILKPLLGHLDPFGGAHVRTLATGGFPSGHSTVAMAASLALMLAVPPAWRGLVAVGGAVYSAAVGVGLVLLEWHYPSDVIAGYLVATIWAALAAAALDAWVAARPERRAVRGRRAVGFGIAGALLVAVAGIAALAAVGAEAVDVGKIELLGRLHTAFFAAALGISVFGVSLPAIVAAVLLRDHVGRRYAGEEVEASRPRAGSGLLARFRPPGRSRGAEAP